MIGDEIVLGGLLVFLLGIGYFAYRVIQSSNTASSDPSSESQNITGDPLQDAARRLQYGLYDEAESTIRRSIQEHPDRKDLQAKLLEILFVRGNAKQFGQAGLEYRESLQSSSQWSNIQLMAKQLCADDPTFH